MRFVRGVLVLVIVAALATAAHVVNAAVRPLSGPDRVEAQVRWLRSILDTQAPQDMQALFPEGAFFTYVLTGLAAARTDDVGGVTRTMLALDRDDVVRVFGDIPELRHGTFYRGWRLLLLTEQVRLTGAGAAELRNEASTVVEALVADPYGVPPSYPHSRWPCDAVVAMAAVIGAYDATGSPLPADVIASWRAKIDRTRDPATGLLAHRIWGEAQADEGPRGSSQAVIQTFWPTIDPTGAAADWDRFVTQFVVREAGLVGVREHVRGSSLGGDVDSGPLILGVSTSASAVTLAAARANGDLTLAAALDREAELLGLPVEFSGERRFAFGVLPVGDAFVAWARTIPVPAGVTQPDTPSPTPAWWAWIGAPLASAALGAVGFVAVHRRIRADAAWDDEDDLD